MICVLDLDSECGSRNAVNNLRKARQRTSGKRAGRQKSIRDQFSATSTQAPLQDFESSGRCFITYICHSQTQTLFLTLQVRTPQRIWDQLSTIPTLCHWCLQNANPVLGLGDTRTRIFFDRSQQIQKAWHTATLNPHLGQFMQTVL